MGLYAVIGEHQKGAMKSGDTLRRDTLRLLQSALKNEAIEKRQTPTDFTDAEIEAVIRRLVKQRKDSIAQYRAGHREDLAAREEAELDLLSAYLPQALPEAELRSLVAEAVAESGATSQTDMGRVMGAAMKRVAGRASGDEVRAIVESLLP